MCMLMYLVKRLGLTEEEASRLLELLALTLRVGAFIWSPIWKICSPLPQPCIKMLPLRSCVDRCTREPRQRT